MSFVFRDYDDKDLPDMLSLFKISFNQEISEEFFEWRYKYTPWGKGIFSLAFQNDRLAASYSVMSSELTLNSGQIIKAGFSMTTMTHPDFRGQGLFPKLANDVYARARDLGYDLVIGFPNDMSYSGFTKKLDWKGFGRVPIFKIINSNISKVAKLENSKNVLILPFDQNFAGSLETLLAKNQYYFNFQFTRSLEYLQWRYTQNPKDQYEIFSIFDNNKLKGYFVLKHYQDGLQNEFIHLIDFYLDDLQLLPEVFIFATRRAIELKVTNVSMWLNVQYIEDMGFSAISKYIHRDFMDRTFFGYKVISDRLSDEILRELTDFANWDIKMSDSDTF